MKSVNTDDGSKVINGFPTNCPFCHKDILPIPLFGHKNKIIIEVLFSCPSPSCNRSFIGYYTYKGLRENYYAFMNLTSVGDFKGKVFSDDIQLISKDFCTIYNQALASEQQNLHEICGVGYRKSLEFLIKDYLIYLRPGEQSEIENKFLGNCITEYVDDAKIKSVAKRAAWLGNDETHYKRRWDGKTIVDLKRLIDLTVHWIEMDLLTKRFESEMPG